jgi:hypothetical protein
MSKLVRKNEYECFHCSTCGCAIADKQRAKGIAEYGQGLEDNPADIARRITYLEEEMVDGLMYCEWIKDRLQEVHHGT